MKFTHNKLIRWVLFVALGLPLGWLFVSAQLEIALAALLLLSLLYLLIRPFQLSVRAATTLFVVYLGLSGLLNVSQPFMADSWTVYAVILFASVFLQPVIALLAIDGIIDEFDPKHRVSDLAVIVLFWICSLLVVFGSTALLRTTKGDNIGLIFALFLVPWLVNGCIFLVASLLATIAMARRHSKIKKAK